MFKAIKGGQVDLAFKINSPVVSLDSPFYFWGGPSLKMELDQLGVWSILLKQYLYYVIVCCFSNCARINLAIYHQVNSSFKALLVS